MDSNLVLLIVSVALGLLFIGVAIPLTQRRVPPNPLYGLRVPATLADETVWYEANAQAGKDMLRVGVLVIVVGAGLYFAPLPFGIKVVVWFLVIEVGVMGMVIHSWRFANQLLKRRQNRDQEGG